MRILVVTNQWFPDDRAGGARVASETARELAQLGHEVVVLAPRVTRARAEVASADGVTLLRAFPRGVLPHTYTDVMYALMESRKLANPPFNVVLAHHPASAVGVLAARLHAPLVLVYHASLPREIGFLRSRLPFGAARLRTYAVEPALRLFERIAVRKAHRVLILSEFTRSLLGEDHPAVAKRAVQVSAGVDLATFTLSTASSRVRADLGVQTDAILLLTARRLEPRMGLDLLLHTLPHLMRRRQVVLAIVGRGSLDQSLRTLSSKLGLDEHVRFLGSIPDEELATLYREADVFVLPTVAYEGFGLVTAEALASGTPVVGTPVGATPELIMPLEPRLLAREATPEALAAAIDTALDLIDPAFRRRCHEYARERFDWRGVIRSWEEALVEAASQAAPRLASDAWSREGVSGRPSRRS